MKIILYISCNVNSVSGAVRSYCQLANALAAKGHDVYAVCNDFRPGRPFYPLDDRVHFVNLDGSGCRTLKPGTWIAGIRPSLPAVCKEAWDRYISVPISKRQNEPLVKFVRETQPDVLIPFGDGNFGYFATLQQSIPKSPVILMSHRTSAENFIRLVDTQERRDKVNACHHLHVLQRSFIQGIQAIYHGAIHPIPNDVPQFEEKDLADLTAEKSKRTITMISRLHSGKQQHLLIQSFAQLAKEYSDWNVEIYGPPHKRKYLWRLQRMIVSLGLIGRVELMGTTHHPLEVLRNSDIFAFPSNFPEGWGRVLTEAMAVGLPCVGLKTAASVNELIVDGVNGFLTDNTPEDFAEKLKILMDDQALRIQMGRTGYEMMKQYAPEKIWDQWEQCLLEILGKPK